MKCAIPDSDIARTIEFHGHTCPGLAIGVRASELAMRELGDPAKVKMVVVTETDMCAVDAIQFLTGCTFGKGNFIHRDLGKAAFSFFDRGTGQGFRAVLSPEAWVGVDRRDRQLCIERFMSLDLDEMFVVTRLESGIPRPPKVLESLVCETCGEAVMESRTRRFAGKTYCIPCFQDVEQKI